MLAYNKYRMTYPLHFNLKKSCKFNDERSIFHISMYTYCHV